MEDTTSAEPSSLLALLKNRTPTITAEEISDLLCRRESFGVGWVILQCVRKAHSTPGLNSRGFRSLDLRGFSVGAGKFGLVASCFPPGSLETLKLGPSVLKDPFWTPTAELLRGGGGETSQPGGNLKTLTVTNCDLQLVEEASPLFRLFPQSLEHLDLSGNNLNRISIEPLGDLLQAGSLLNLLSLNLSDNPLGPLGVQMIIKGLPPTLQDLRLARTSAGPPAAEMLAKAIKEKKLTSLRTLDLEMNGFSFVDLQHVTDALVVEGAAPLLRVLDLKKNHRHPRQNPQLSLPPPRL